MASYSPNSVVTLGVLTVVVKGRCLIQVSRGPGWLVRRYVLYIHSPRIPRSASRLCSLAESGGARRVLVTTLVVVPCTFSDTVVSFRGRRRGNLAHSLAHLISSHLISLFHHRRRHVTISTFFTTTTSLDQTFCFYTSRPHTASCRDSFFGHMP